MLKICIAGSVVRDLVKTFSGDTFSSLGGVLYNIYAFFLLKARDFVLFPVFFLGRDDLPKVKKRFSSIPIDWSYVVEWDETDENTIVYKTREDREESYVKKTPFLEARYIPKGMDGYLINFIHQGDFPDGLPDLEGCVYVDLHKRSFFLTDTDLDGLLGKVRILQCNKEEFGAVKERFGVSPLFDFLDYIVVTEGSKGAWLYDGVKSHFMPAPKVDVVDPTGAGDVFGSVFLYTFLKTHDPIEALHMATKVASESVRYKGIW